MAQKIYAFIDPTNTGKFNAEFVEVVGVFNSPPNLSETNESIREYVIKTGDFSFVARRNKFFLNGDTFTASTKTSLSNKSWIVLEVTSSLIRVKVVGDASGYYSFKSYDDFSSLIEVDSIKRDRLSAINFDTESDSTMAQNNISNLENEVFKLNQNILDLNTIRSFLTPLQFEEKITITNQIEQIQKEVNNKIFQITEAEVSQKNDGQSIIDKLFENSFKGIQHDYTMNVVSDEDNPDFFAPNGDASKLSNEINFIIRTPQFKSWFGDWQLAYQFKDDEDYQVPCSKIVTENGEPEIYWHGTGAPFSYFKFDTFPAAYFAKNKEYSRFFAELHGGDEGYLLPFFLNVRNPLDLRLFKTNKVSSREFLDYIFVATGMDADELQVNPIMLDPKTPPLETWVYLRNNQVMLKKLSMMYDGIRFYETNPNKEAQKYATETEAVIVFSPHQVKLATEKRGDFILSSLRSFLLGKGGKI